MPAPLLPPEVKRTIYSLALAPSTAETEYVVLLSGVVTAPPKETEEPLILIPAFTKAVLGMLDKKFVLPEIVHVSKVLLVTV